MLRAVAGVVGGALLGVDGAGAQVTQAQCGNRQCANDPGVCADGCVCCVYANGNSRCRPPGTCAPGTAVCPTGEVVDPVAGCVAPVCGVQDERGICADTVRCRVAAQCSCVVSPNRTEAFCADFTVGCGRLTPCPNGQSDCAARPGTFCAIDPCCGGRALCQSPCPI